MNQYTWHTRKNPNLHKYETNTHVPTISSFSPIKYITMLLFYVHENFSGRIFIQTLVYFLKIPVIALNRINKFVMFQTSQQICWLLLPPQSHDQNLTHQLHMYEVTLAKANYLMCGRKCLGLSQVLSLVKHRGVSIPTF